MLDKDKTIAFRLSVEDYEIIRNYGLSIGANTSTVIRMALMKYIFRDICENPTFGGITTTPPRK